MVSMRRIVKPELLDELPPDDALAIGSRQDLRRLNAIMGNARILTEAFCRTPVGHRAGPLKVLELGGGDGTLLLKLARDWSQVGVIGEAVLVDRDRTLSSEVQQALSALNWRVTPVISDVFEWLKGFGGCVDLVLANLFLHHFPDPELRELLRLIAARTKQFIACEPRRSGITLNASRLLALIGCNAVTRHDAVVSVRAGFRDGELSALWPAGVGWLLDERKAGLFSHCFAAKRNE